MVAFQYSLVAVLVIAFVTESVVTDSSVDENGIPVTDVLKEKWGMIFDYADIDKDGLYSVDDEFGFAERLIDNYNASGDLAQGFRQYGVLYKDVVEAYNYGADTTKTALTRSEYIEAHGWYFSNHYNMFKLRVGAWFTAIFQAADSDDDGGISFTEFQAAYNIYGDPFSVKNKSKSAFNLFDIDRNDLIDEDEFLDVHLKFALDPYITGKELPLY